MELKLDFCYDVMDRRGLLIVPYGIETHQPHARSSPGTTFNRTLWN